MQTVLVWVLMTVGGYNSNQISYSPSVADYESCKRMQEVGIASANGVATHRGTCVQIKVYTPAK